MVLKESRTGLEKKFYDLCLNVVEAEGLSLYDLEYHPSRGLLRVYIFNKETKTALLDDCVRVDRVLTPYIENEAWMPNALTLEVSSPGINRFLRAREHFQQAQGQKISVVVTPDWNKGMERELPEQYKGQKNFRGLLKEVREQVIVLDLSNCDLELQYEVIKKANLDPDWP